MSCPAIRPTRILNGALSPTVLPYQSAPTAAPSSDTSTKTPIPFPQQQQDQAQLAASAPGVSASSTFESGLALFASLDAENATEAEAECGQLRRALAEKETEIQTKNLLLLRSKDALFQLNERLVVAQRDAACALAEKEEVERALAKAHTAIIGHEQRIESLQLSLQDALEDAKRGLTDARQEWDAQTQQLTMDNDRLKACLSESEQMTASLHAKICVIEASAEERESCLRQQLAQEARRTAEARAHAETASAELQRAEAEAHEQLEKERKSRKQLAERVAMTEDAVLAQMKKKEAEVEALQLRVDSHQKHLRRLASPALSGMSPSMTPSSISTRRLAGSTCTKSRSIRRRNTSNQSSATRAKRQLIGHANVYMDKENMTPQQSAVSVLSSVSVGAPDVMSLKKSQSKEAQKMKQNIKKKIGLTVRSDCTNKLPWSSPKVEKRKKKRRGRQVASRYLTTSMR